MARFAPVAVVLVAGCTCACEPNWSTVSLAFCDPDESCFDGVGGNEPGFKCGDVICDMESEWRGCVEGWTCTAGGECIGIALTPDADDDNLCTVDTCEGGGWIHTPYTAEDIDDDDPCTFDQCSPGLGITHAQMANCP